MESIQESPNKAANAIKPSRKRSTPPGFVDEGKDVKRTRPEEVTPSVRTLLDSLAAWEDRRVRGAVLGYRNKVTYNVNAGCVELTDLASSVCNDTVQSVLAICREVCTAEEWTDLEVFREISVKCSRRNHFLLKLLFRGRDDTRFEDKVFPKIMTSLTAVFSERMECVVTQSSVGKARPTKHNPYCAVLGSALTETTPWGDEYLLSPDTFSEVNHEAEDRLWEYFSELMENQKKRGNLVFMGRDSNAAVVSFYKRYGHCFEGFVCLPHCPRVAHDLALNTQQFAGKVTILPVEDKFAYAERIHSVCGSTLSTVILNAGRGGLAHHTASALRAHRLVETIIYISCNQQTSYQDLSILLSSTYSLCTQCEPTPAHPFSVSGYSCYEFQPGTDYVMQVFELRRIPRSVLVLPIGPPGCGKSSVGVILGHSGANIIERDALYATQRNGGASLKQAKRETHSGILSALRNAGRGITYYDSTSGDPDGRVLMCTEFANREERTEVILINYDVSFEGSEEWLLANCMQRVGHVAFPSDRDAAVTKIANVRLGLHQAIPGAILSSAAITSETVITVPPRSCPPSTLARLIQTLSLLTPTLSADIPLPEFSATITVTLQGNQS